MENFSNGSSPALFFVSTYAAIVAMAYANNQIVPASWSIIKSGPGIQNPPKPPAMILTVKNG